MCHLKFLLHGIPSIRARGEVRAHCAELPVRATQGEALEYSLSEIRKALVRGIEEADESAGAKARTWWTEKKVSVALSRESAEKATGNLQKQLHKLTQAVAA